MPLLSADSFNRANAFLHGSVTDGTGSRDPRTWAALDSYDTSAGLGISSNKVSDNGNDISTVKGYHISTVDLSAADVALSITILGTGSATMSSGIAFRASDFNNFFYACLESGGNVVLYKMATGTETTVNSVAVSGSPTTGTLLVRCVGNTISVLLNGVQRIIVTDSFNSTVTKHGIGMRNSAAAGLNSGSMDNWSASSLTNVVPQPTFPLTTRRTSRLATSGQPASPPTRGQFIPPIVEPF